MILTENDRISQEAEILNFMLDYYDKMSDDFFFHYKVVLLFMGVISGDVDVYGTS